ncbi:MAG TPA: nucleoside hydrolase [Candidatus Gallacutalibacter stercoravium]|nr:nucleoside hydrolase [Candidatus Gallacutalibacter stercoravium]
MDPQQYHLTDPQGWRRALEAFPVLPEEKRVARLAPPLPGKRLSMVLDTDAYNEIDDQFAIAYALSSPDRLDVQAVYAAPFFNERSVSFGDGMEKSYEEIGRVLQRLGKTGQVPVLRGSTGHLAEGLQSSEAAQDLVRRAMMAQDTLYVVSIGAITNVASALLLEPRIAEKIVVVWLGGHAHNWSDTCEFNLDQDRLAARLVLDCGVPLVQMPCLNVVDHLTTTVAELERFLEPKSAIGAFLTENVRSEVAKYAPADYPASRVIWDLVPVAWLVDPSRVDTRLTHTPRLTGEGTWSLDTRRPLMRVGASLNRDAIFADVFQKLG